VAGNGISWFPMTPARIAAQSGDRRLILEVSEDGDALVVSHGTHVHRILLDRGKRCIRSAEVDGRPVRFGCQRKGDVWEVLLDGTVYEVAVSDPRCESLLRVRPAAAEATGRLTVRAPIPGLVTAHRVQPGARVARNQCLLVLAAMKLENEIAAPRDAVVVEILAPVGKPVEKNDPLVLLE